MSIVQPLIRPLYATRTAHELLAYMHGAASASSHDLVRATWQAHAGGADFETWWRQALQDGVIADTLQQHVSYSLLRSCRPWLLGQTTTGLSLTAGTGTHPCSTAASANNAWLQECPRATDAAGLGQRVTRSRPKMRGNSAWLMARSYA